MHATNGHYVINDEAGQLDVGYIHKFLSEESYWAQGRELAVTEEAIRNSLCLGLYDTQQGGQIGFARVVTDYATFGWLADVFIDPAYRGHGLGQWLVECVVTHPALAGLKQIVLATRDAHGLYEKYGFVETPPGRFMARRQDNR